MSEGQQGTAEIQEENSVIATIQKILADLDILRSIGTLEILIPGVAERWKEMMERGQQALQQLQDLIDGFQSVLEHHYYRAEDALDMLDEDEEEDIGEEEQETGKEFTDE